MEGFEVTKRRIFYTLENFEILSRNIGDHKKMTPKYCAIGPDCTDYPTVEVTKITKDRKTTWGTVLPIRMVQWIEVFNADDVVPTDIEYDLPQLWYKY